MVRVSSNGCPIQVCDVLKAGPVSAKLKEIMNGKDNVNGVPLSINQSKGQLVKKIVKGQDPTAFLKKSIMIWKNRNNYNKANQGVV